MSDSLIQESRGFSHAQRRMAANASEDFKHWHHVAVADVIDKLADRLEAAEAENARLREAGQYMLRAFDHAVVELPPRRRAGFDDLRLMVARDAKIQSVAEARAALSQPERDHG